MALLPTLNRQKVWSGLQRSLDCPGGITKVQLQAVVDATDQWAEDNSASFNTAIPQPQRGILTARQKAFILAAVLDERFNLS